MNLGWMYFTTIYLCLQQRFLIEVIEVTKYLLLFLFSLLPIERLSGKYRF